MLQKKKIFVYLRLPEKNREMVTLLEEGIITTVEQPLLRYYPLLLGNLMGRSAMTKCTENKKPVRRFIIK
jgi:hypothetical protein